MIKAEDAQFHTADADKPNWAETNYFGFYSAEANLNVGVYALFRPNLGIVNSTISINSRRALTPWEADYNDLQSHLPIPEPRDLLDYQLANGLKVKCLVPNTIWTIDYDDGHGTEIHVKYSALMKPFDIHDPDMDPIVAAQAEQGKFAWGTAYNGHFDQTGHVAGEVAVRGRRYRIDCVSTMDHSWGPRPERGAPNMSWLHAHFSERFVVHAIFSFDETEGGRTLSLSHGYVLQDGKVYGLKSGTGATVRTEDRYPEHIQLALTDIDNRTWELRGDATTTFPWQCWPNMVAFNTLSKWQCQEHIGYGEVMDFFEVPSLTRLNATPETAVFIKNRG
ncbi:MULTISPECIES: DUF7064 domain-containing protein [Paraburkholderia]|uniref:Uncharacterized protein n=1 Tax=Paraburkholderia podalyriae TaxID=1938811 RepID=A0ABR7Q0S6_9BURK|nr:hypothetical protein [Paraburkholderia podalyriae]MBC8752092.1 hypothetical protein [Paraburkholderia podalyriae]